MNLNRNPRIVIIGGGFAGMMAIRSLNRRMAAAGARGDIHLIDAGPGHALIPEIPHVLERGLDMHSRILDFSALLPDTEMQLHQGRVCGVDRQHRQVLRVHEEPIGYDYALLAVGTEAAFPNVPGLHAHAWPVRTAADAIHVTTMLRRQPTSRVVIAGGGFTGVELAGSLRTHHVILLEQRDSLLPNMDPTYGRYASKVLHSLGVDVRLSEKLMRVDASTVYTDSDEFRYNLLIWAGGIKPPHWIQQSGIPCDRRGYPMASAWGQIDEHLFVAGDLWPLRQFSGNVPVQTAEASTAMGDFVGRVMAARILGTRVPPAFQHRARGMIVSLGLRRGVGWLFMPSMPLHGVLAGKLKRAALYRYRQEIGHRRNQKHCMF